MDSFLPKRDQEYLKAKGLQYSEIRDGNKNGLVISNYPLPKGKFSTDITTLLILIPQGYNDAHPDMFFCHPKLTFAGVNRSPAQTEGVVAFNSLQWQQWSRHLNTGNDWRPGIDGIDSYLQKVNYAFKTA
jgi:hypothetical protein